MSQRKSQQKSVTGKFGFAGKGLVALLALTVLGGGAFWITRISNQNKPVINIQGSSAEGGNANVTVQNTDASGTQSDSGNSTHTSNGSQQTAPNTVVDLTTSTQWALRFPLYQQEDSGCIIVGTGSTSLKQDTSGFLEFNGFHNFYDYGVSIQGTITPSGNTNISISAPKKELVITLESSKIGSDNGEILVTGKTSALNCPNGEFEMRYQR